MNAYIRGVILPGGRDYDPFKVNSNSVFNREDQEHVAELQQDAIDREFNERAEIEELIDAHERDADA